MLAKNRTHCSYGHEFTEDNTIHYKNGQRKCRECCNFRNRERRLEVKLTGTSVDKRTREFITFCKNGHPFTVENTLFEKNGVRRRCRICAYAKNDKYAAKVGKEYIRLKHRQYQRKYLYKISDETYNTLLKGQRGKCANELCTETDRPAYRRGLHIDHDHNCCPTYKNDRQSCGKCVRGLLCYKCNCILGLAHDSEVVLLGLVEYLKVWRKSTQESLSEEIPTTSALKEKKAGLGLGAVSTE